MARTAQQITADLAAARAQVAALEAELAAAQETAEETTEGVDYVTATNGRVIRLGDLVTARGSKIVRRVANINGDRVRLVRVDGVAVAQSKWTRQIDGLRPAK